MCSWNSRLDLKMRPVAPAPRKAWRVGRPTALSIGSATASDGMLSDMRRWRWGFPVPFPISFANSPKRTYDHHLSGETRLWMFGESMSAHSTLHQPISSCHRVCCAADVTTGAGRTTSVPHCSATAVPPPLRGAGEANLGCTELMRGKAARHSVGAILQRSALTRRGWRHGMGHADGVLRSANLNESIPFGPNNPVTVMRPSFDPMSSAHRRGE